MNSVMNNKYGPWALITGASSGIGEEFSRQLAEMGFNLVLVARREQRLQKLAAKLRQCADIEIRILVADLSKTDFMNTISEAVKELEIGLLINNAGFAITGPFLDNQIDQELELLNVNCRAPMVLAHYFGQLMQQRGKGGIVFVGSVVSFSATPLWSQYAASKAYVLLLAEALSAELEEHKVDVLAICPGPTSTEFQQVAGIRDFMSMQADKVVSIGLQSLGRKRVVIPGFLNKYNNFWLRFFPRFVNTWLFGYFTKKVKI